jgi:ribosome maturation factor RimP
MYRDIPESLLRVIEPVVRSHGLELVDAAVGRGPTRSLVRVIVDTPSGDGRVKVDDCAAVSRELGPGLDVAELIDGAYTLEVSSPGVDRTLGREVDFVRAVGRKVALETRAPIDGRRRFKGAADGGTFAIPFGAVERAKAFHPLDTQQKPKKR